MLLWIFRYCPSNRTRQKRCGVIDRPKLKHPQHTNEVFPTKQILDWNKARFLCLHNVSQLCPTTVHWHPAHWDWVRPLEAHNHLRPVRLQARTARFRMLDPSTRQPTWLARGPQEWPKHVVDLVVFSCVQQLHNKTWLKKIREKKNAHDYAHFL